MGDRSHQPGRFHLSEQGGLVCFWSRDHRRHRLRILSGCGGPVANQTTHQSPLSVFLFGLWAFLVSSVPIWLTSKQLSGGGRWDDRFALAMMPGAVIMTWRVILWLVRARRRKLLLGLLLMFSIATQVLIVNRYRLDWQVQRTITGSWPGACPHSSPGRPIFSFEQPSASIPGYDASFALNVLYRARLDGSTPYWFFTNDRFLNFDFVPGQGDLILRSKPSVHREYLSGHFDRASGSRTAACKCWMRPIPGNRSMKPIRSNWSASRMYPASQRTPERQPPDPDVFGAEPPHQWCYYFEKADLARQMQDWQPYSCWKNRPTSRAMTPKFGPEYIPFIEAYAQYG